MINLKENEIALMNLGATINELNSIDKMIEYYSDRFTKVHISLQNYDAGRNSIQMNGSIFVEALYQQRDVLVAYLEKLGIEA